MNECLNVRMNAEDPAHTGYTFKATKLIIAGIVWNRVPLEQGQRNQHQEQEQAHDFGSFPPEQIAK